MMAILILAACMVLFLLVVVFVFAPQLITITCKPIKDIPADAFKIVSECHK